VLVRQATPRDVEALAEMRARLWPDADRPTLRSEAEAIVAGRPPSTLPLVAFVAEEGGLCVGFVEVGLRSHADGCDASRPCGFIEGWYVEPSHRRRGIGRALSRQAESWAREQGCLEMASDTWLDSRQSQDAHLALGFEVVDRCVHFRKSLAPPDG